MLGYTEDVVFDGLLIWIEFKYLIESTLHDLIQILRHQTVYISEKCNKIGPG